MRGWSGRCGRWAMIVAASALFMGCGDAEGAPPGAAPPAEPADASTIAPPDAGPIADAAIEAAGDAAVDATASTACLDELTRRGVGFTRTTAKGVIDAVKLTGPIAGVLFTTETSTTPMTDPVACEFVKTLWSFAELLRSRGYVKVGTLGSYCYRCCCAWSPTNFCRGPSDPEPDCSKDGYSNHSWGRALDVRYLTKADGTRYDVNDPSDFVVSTAGDTCGAGLAAQTGVSRELYTVACQASAQKIFGTVLTPNYNAAHRNHFHMDTGRTGTPSSFVVRSSSSGEADRAGFEGCGDE